MKKIRNRTVRRFMNELVDLYRKYGNPIYDGQIDNTLRERADFRTVVRFLESLHYLNVSYDTDGNPRSIIVTDSGNAYIEVGRNTRTERRIDRILSISALVISIISLIIAAYSVFCL